METSRPDPEAREFDSVIVPREMPPGWRVLQATGADIEIARTLEYEVFVEAGFCDASPTRSVAEFEAFEDDSIFMVAVSPDGRIHGTVRLMVGAYDDLPVASFPRDRPYPTDPVLEYASLAVTADSRQNGVAESLYRAVWQQALRRGVDGIVAITEQWLMSLLNDTFDFGFQKLGPTRWYMGGECFPMGVSIDDLLQRASRQPSFLRWGVAEIDLRDLPRPETRTLVRRAHDEAGA